MSKGPTWSWFNLPFEMAYMSLAKKIWETSVVRSLINIGVDSGMTHLKCVVSKNLFLYPRILFQNQENSLFLDRYTTQLNLSNLGSRLVRDSC